MLQPAGTNHIHRNSPTAAFEIRHPKSVLFQTLLPNHFVKWLCHLVYIGLHLVYRRRLRLR